MSFSSHDSCNLWKCSPRRLLISWRKLGRTQWLIFVYLSFEICLYAFYSYSKSMDLILWWRDLSGILSGLTKEFNIDKFLAVLLESLMEYGSDDDTCHHVLLSLISTVPVNALVGRLVSKLLSTSMKLSKKGTEISSSASGLISKC